MRAEAAQRGEARRRLQRQLPVYFYFLFFTGDASRGGDCNVNYLLLLAALLALLAVVLRGSVLTNFFGVHF
jgi:hypothetical protein